MPTYIVLGKFTDQGLRTSGEGRQRQQATQERAERLGGRLLGAHVTQGHYDVVLLVELPDEASAAAFLLETGQQGNLRTETLRAFTPEELEQAQGKMTPL